MKRIAKTIFILILIASFFGCHINPPKPSFTDRTKGWIPAFDFKYAFYIDLYEMDHPVFYCFLFNDSQLKAPAALPDTNMTPEQIMEYGLKLAFRDRYIDIGEDSICVETFTWREGMCLYSAGSTRVILDTNNNAVVQCIDSRIQSHFDTRRNPENKNVEFHVDLAQLTSEEVRVFAAYLAPPMEFGEYRFDQADLPLTAEKAFQTSAEDIYNRYAVKSGGFGGGEYRVYDCERSNSWLIRNKSFTQMFDKDTGECILLTWGATDLSVRG